MSRGPKDTSIALLGTLLALAVILLYLPGAFMFKENVYTAIDFAFVYDEALLSPFEELYKHTLLWSPEA